MRSGSTSGCCSSTSRPRARSQRFCASGLAPAATACTRLRSHPYLSGGLPVGPFAEVAEVGCEHDVAALGEADARSRRCARRSRRGSSRRRGRTPRTCRDRVRAARAPPGPARSRSCGTSRNAGTDMVASLSNTIESRRVRAAVDGLAHLEIERHPLGHRAEQRVEPRPAPLAPRRDRARIVDRARIARDELRRGAASSTPTARSCAPVRSRGGDGTVRLPHTIGSHAAQGVRT